MIAIPTAPFRTTRPARLLRLVALVAVVWTFIGSGPQSRHPLIIVAIVITCLGWVVLSLTPDRWRWAQRAALLSMALFGGLIVAPVGYSTISVLGAVLMAVALLNEPIGMAICVPMIAALATCISYAVDGSGVGQLLWTLVSIALVALMGWSRRQFRVTAEQNRLLVEQSRMIRAERDRAAAIAERGRIARDIHDVLSHTLGGLVIQLDAADALLEAGEHTRAAARVRKSHTLAVSGLADARNVVRALRDETVDLVRQIGELAAAHRATGGTVTVEIVGDSTGIDQQVSVALTRAVQESLTNARKHAPGASVEVSLKIGTRGVELVVANPTSGRSGLLGSAGSGAGLLGMRERITALGGTLDTGREDGRWTVQIHVPSR